MERDLRNTALYQEAEALHRIMRRPGTGLISDAAEIKSNGTQAVFTGSIVEQLISFPSTRICLIDLSTAAIRVLTSGPHTDRSPKFSPDGRWIAFLSDRSDIGDFQLYLLDATTGAVTPTPRAAGWVEYLHWSPDGKRILLGVAGHAADVSGSQGAIKRHRQIEGVPSWMPTVETSDETDQWRCAYLYELATDSTQRVGALVKNVWEVVWCGNDALAAIVSPAAGEGFWYSARLEMLSLKDGGSRELYLPTDQLGWPAASPSGEYLAVVEAVCSDRWVVAGDLKLIHTATGVVEAADTAGVDITHTEWRSNRHLLLGGHRGFETVVGLYDLSSRRFTEVWASRHTSGAGRYLTLAGLDERADCVLVGESFVRAPEIATIVAGKYSTLRSLDLASGEIDAIVSGVESVTWMAPDGLEIQGWLLRPDGRRPHPLVMHIHSGPVWQIRPMWLGRSLIHLVMLLRRGYAVFFPNPRGSSGRGREFARRVMGDVAGADTHDYLSGLDHLVSEGVADGTRLGVTGASYGGFMTAWLVTQATRFAAAVAVAPITNQVTAQLLSNIPHFVALSLADTYSNPGGKYFQRSPVMYAHQAKTPTLNICGALDRCTPPEEAVQFHNALLQSGVESALVTYPEEGHGIAKWPASIDYAARLVGWMEAHMPAQESRYE